MLAIIPSKQAARQESQEQSNRVRASSTPRSSISRCRRKYSIGIVCALPHEADAVGAVLDHKLLQKESLERADGDTNRYTFGLIGEYHVVIVHLAGMGPVEAAQAAESMSRSFRGIKLCLVVGICGSIPEIGSGADAREVLLGDIIISTRLKQYTMGSRYPRGFVMKETLGRPDRGLRSLFESLKIVDNQQELRQDLYSHLQALLGLPSMKAFSFPGYDRDHLYDPVYLHEHPHASCQTCAQLRLCEAAIKTDCTQLECDATKLKNRERIRTIRQLESRLATTAALSMVDLTLQNQLYDLRMPEVFLEGMASGDEVMKSGADRDRVAKEHDVVGFEMEGAGVWDVFPTVVVKGVCDYADSHKNKVWQRYAAATAAACARAFLELYRPALDDFQKSPDLDWSTTMVSGDRADFNRGWQSLTPNHKDARLRNEPIMLQEIQLFFQALQLLKEFDSSAQSLRELVQTLQDFGTTLHRISDIAKENLNSSGVLSLAQPEATSHPINPERLSLKARLDIDGVLEQVEEYRKVLAVNTPSCVTSLQHKLAGIRITMMKIKRRLTHDDTNTIWQRELELYDDPFVVTSLEQDLGRLPRVEKIETSTSGMGLGTPSQTALAGGYNAAGCLSAEAAPAHEVQSGGSFETCLF